MQRRAFSRHLLATGAAILAPAAVVHPSLALAQAAGPQRYQEGRDYVRLDRPAPVDVSAGQIEVLEFFAYTCIHCFNFEPVFDQWRRRVPAHVLVRRVPVVFSEAFVPLQRLYYTLEAMGQLDALHGKVFEAIHVQRQRLVNEAAITAWVEKQGVDRQKFSELFNSFSVTGKARRAGQLQDAYQVEGTPALGVAGRYMIPGQGPRTVQIADALIAQLS
jgi:thiol:disulfide interchange protein DsbA